VDDVNEAAIQGELGSFSHQAARQLLGEDARILACTGFEELFARVNAGEAGYGLVPVENTLAGSVTENLDLLTAHPLHVTGETTVRVELCVLGRPGTRLEDAKRAASHPVALRQCRGFFRSHPWIEPVPVYDTAGSVRDLLAGPASYDLAIGSALAAELYGADVLLSGIEDDRANFTRFLVVERDAGPPESGPVRTMMAFVVPHRPGSLHRALRALAEEGLDLTNLESRPIPGKPWEYRFYAGATARSHPDLSRAVERLARMSVEARVFGSWHERGSAEEA
jgi:prephenate dehydratase